MKRKSDILYLMLTDNLLFKTSLRVADDFLELPNGDMASSDSTIVQILGGPEALEALTADEDDDDDEDEDDDDDDGGFFGFGFATSTEEKKKKLRPHNYNPIHSDGLHDFVGIGYVVDEVIRTRFSIFPQTPVTIGSSWERSLKLSDGINPSVQADIIEEYKLIAVSRAGSRFKEHNVGSSELIAEIEFTQREKPIHLEQEGNKIPGVDDGEEKSTTGVDPQFSRPSFKGHEFSTRGTIFVHLNTGFVLQGQSTGEAKSERAVMIINKRKNSRKIVNAKVEISASTKYIGRLA